MREHEAYWIDNWMGGTTNLWDNWLEGRPCIPAREYCSPKPYAEVLSHLLSGKELSDNAHKWLYDYCLGLLIKDAKRAYGKKSKENIKRAKMLFVEEVTRIRQEKSCGIEKAAEILCSEHPELIKTMGYKSRDNDGLVSTDSLRRQYVRADKKYNGGFYNDMCLYLLELEKKQKEHDQEQSEPPDGKK